MPLILHAADIHLDSPLRGLERYPGAPLGALRGATRRALETMVDRALERKADLVVIAGDLYDGDGDDYATALFLNSQMDRLHQAKIPVCVIRGNHDAVSVLTRYLHCPPNVHILSADHAGTQFFEEIGVAVHGQSFASRAVTSNLAASYPKAVPGLFNLGVLHTSMDGRDGHEPYAPCSLDDLKGRGYQYWALGHVHTPEVLCKDPLVVMPGNLQGRHARECGERGCVWVHVTPGREPIHESETLNVVRWETVTVNVTGVGGLEEVLDLADKALAVTVEQAGAELLAARIHLKGTTTAHGRLVSSQDRLTAELRRAAGLIRGRPVWVEKVKLQTQAPSKPFLEDGPLGTLSEVISELRSRPEEFSSLVNQAIEDLRKKLPHELSEGDLGPQPGDPAWLSSLLDRAEARLEAGLLNAGEEVL